MDAAVSFIWLISLTLAARQLDERLSGQASNACTGASISLRKMRSSTETMSKHPAFELLDALYDSVQCLKQCSLDAELHLATTELACLIWNYRHFPPRCNTLEDAIGATFAARNWLRFIPDAPRRLASQDFGAQILIAHWETFFFLILNMASLDEHAFFLKDRETSIKNLLQRFHGHDSGQHENSMEACLTNKGDDLKQQRLNEKVRLKWIALAQSTLQICRLNGPSSCLPFNTT